MKIALVTETFPPEVNGVAMTNERLVRGLLGLGHEILLIKPKRAEAVPLVNESLQTLEVFGIPIPNYAGLKMGLPAPGQLENELDVYRPDIVHIATEGPLGFSALRAAIKLNIPATSTFHTNFQDYCADYGAAFAGRAMMHYLRWFHNKCALTTVPDQKLIERLAADGVENLKMLGRGADTELFNPARRSSQLRAEWGADDSTPVAIYVGRAAAEKNIPLALETWKQAQQSCPDLKMVVVGDGPVRRRLEKSWPEVHFAGMRYNEDLATHYASADIFLFASESETFGNVVVEALASGLVTLTYDYAAGRQFIQTGENGVLAPFGDSKALLELLRSILADRNSWPHIRKKARETAEAYPWSNTIERFAGLLERAMRPEQIPVQIDIASLPSDARS